MKNAAIMLTVTGALALMIVYHLIPFLILDRGAESLARLRPFLVGSSLILMLLGLVQLWRAKHSTSRPSRFTVIAFWLSSVLLLCTILFPGAIASFLADVFVS
jgi:hypothetical protein